MKQIIVTLAEMIGKLIARFLRFFGLGHWESPSSYVILGDDPEVYLLTLWGSYWPTDDTTYEYIGNYFKKLLGDLFMCYEVGTENAVFLNLEVELESKKPLVLFHKNTGTLTIVIPKKDAEKFENSKNACWKYMQTATWFVGYHKSGDPLVGCYFEKKSLKNMKEYFERKPWCQTAGLVILDDQNLGCQNLEGSLTGQGMEKIEKAVSNLDKKVKKLLGVSPELHMACDHHSRKNTTDMYEVVVTPVVSPLVKDPCHVSVSYTAQLVVYMLYHLNDDNLMQSVLERMHLTYSPFLGEKGESYTGDDPNLFWKETAPKLYKKWRKPLGDDEK